MRIAPGLSCRFGSRRGKNAGAEALIMLAIVLAVWAIELLVQAAIILAAFLWWLIRLAVAITQELLERRKARRAAAGT